MKALLHKPSPAIADCELTFIDRDPINYSRALMQHTEYAQTLRKLGAAVEILDVNPDCPDGVFVEDVAVLVDEIAIITTMGSETRRAELPKMAENISRFRELKFLSLPATLEGGDVLKVGRIFFVGLSARTNKTGIEDFTKLVSTLGYQVTAVPVPGCLHLKTCITALDEETFIVNPAWLDVSKFKNFKLIEVDESEPCGANVLPVKDTLVLNAAFPRCADKIDSLGYKTTRVDISEFVKAEAGLTCMSLVFNK